VSDESTNGPSATNAGRAREAAARSFDFLPLTIRLETFGGVATPLVLRGTPLPTKRAEVFSTASDNQTSVEVSLIFGERPLVRDNAHIGTFHLRDIPAAPRGEPQIAVEFAVDKQCSITARASLQGTDFKAEKTFRLPADLSDERVKEALAEAERSRESDELELRRIEAVNRAKTLIAKAEKKLSSGSDVKLNEAVAALGLALASDNSDAIREKSDVLEQCLSPTFDFSADDLFGTFFQSPSTSLTGTKAAVSQRPSKALRLIRFGGRFSYARLCSFSSCLSSQARRQRSWRSAPP
jgi:molecular chaperone DnaK (HSP70)